MTIRKYKPSDMAETAALIYRTVKTMQRTDKKGWSDEYANIWDMKTNKEDIVQRFSSKLHTMYVTIENGKIVGMIRVAPQRGVPSQEKKYHVGNLFVDPKKQRQGVGEALFLKIEKSLAQRHAKSVRVFSSMYAVPFYQKVGFKKSTGKKKHFGVWTQPMRKVF